MHGCGVRSHLRHWRNRCLDVHLLHVISYNRNVMLYQARMCRHSIILKAGA
jgi:hypothetical protein